jgi:hypothetical protein
MKSDAAATNSSSQVSMRFLVSGPVSSIFCLPTLPPARLLGGVLLVGCPGVHDAARAEVLVELRKVLLRRIVVHLGSSSAFRWYRLPKNSSKPWLVGSMWLRSPRWFLPNWPVA